MKKTHLSLFVVILVGLGVVACQTESTDWRFLLATSGHAELAYDSNRNLLWIFDEANKRINYIAMDMDGDDIQVQHIPYPVLDNPQNSVLDFCASGDLWVVTDMGELLLYDSQSQTWIANLSILGRVRSCEPLESERIAIVVDKNMIDVVTNHDVSMLSDIPGSIKNLRQDEHGNIWVLSQNSLEDGYVLYKEETEGNWSEQSRLVGNRLLLLTENSVWTAGGSVVTIFESSIENAAVLTPPMRQMQVSGLLLDMVSDKNKNIWIVTNESVMLKTADNDDFSTVPLPGSVDRIISSTGDLQNCLIYISTDIGILYNTNNCK